MTEKMLFFCVVLFIISGCSGQQDKETLSKYPEKCTVNFYAGEVKVNGRSNIYGRTLKKGDRLVTRTGKIDFGSGKMSAVRLMTDSDLVYNGLAEDGPEHTLLKGKALINNRKGKITVYTGIKQLSYFSTAERSGFSVEVLPDIVKAYVYDGILEYRQSDENDPVLIEPGFRFFIRANKFKKEKYMIPWDQEELAVINNYVVDKGQCKPYIDGCDPKQGGSSPEGSAWTVPIDRMKLKIDETKKSITRGISDGKEEITGSMEKQKEELSEKIDESWKEFKKKMEKRKKDIKDSVKERIDKI